MQMGFCGRGGRRVPALLSRGWPQLPGARRALGFGPAPLHVAKWRVAGGEILREGGNREVSSFTAEAGLHLPGPRGCCRSVGWGCCWGAERQRSPAGVAGWGPQGSVVRCSVLLGARRA